MESIPDSLLREIVMHPADDAPRLVCADWLEEHGDAPRAELIRLQIQLASTPSQHPDCAAWRMREGELLMMWADRWRPPPRACVRWGRFGRGWVEEVRIVDWNEFQQQADDIFAVTPLTVLHGDGRRIDRKRLVYLSEFPQMQRIKELALFDCRIGQEATVSLAHSAGWAQLTHLELGANWMGERGAMELAASPYLTQLTYLGLRDNFLGDMAAAALAGSQSLHSVRTLELSYNHITEVGADHFRSPAVLPNLRRLGLVDNPVSDDMRSLVEVRFPEAFDAWN